MDFREWVRRSIGIDEFWDVEEPSFDDGPLRMTVPIVYLNLDFLSRLSSTATSIFV